MIKAFRALSLALFISFSGQVLAQDILDGTEDLPPPTPREATIAPAASEASPSQGSKKKSKEESEESAPESVNAPMAMSSTSVPDEPVVEWDKRQGAEQRLRQYGPDILGDQIDPHTGVISFEHTDVSIPGNSALEVAIRRRRSQGLFYHESVDVEFGDWQLVVPRIYALSANQSWLGDRCSNSYTTSFPLHSIGGGSHFQNSEYSNGVMMDVPGAGAMQVLEGPQGAHWPAAATHTTTEGWWLECTTASDGGQGFLAHAPNGDVYKFDEYYTVQAHSLGVWGSNQVARTRNFLAASEVTDVHGNWVKYDYDANGRLTKIHSNDGRVIDVNYTGTSKLISSVTANSRTWQYDYRALNYSEPFEIGNFITSHTVDVLDEVTQPDGFSWTFQLDDMVAQAGPGDQCHQVQPRSVSLTHPYGASGTFTLYEKKHRQSFNALAEEVLTCPNDDVTSETDPQLPYNVTTFETMSVTRKTLSGPGFSTATWNYTYEEDHGAAGSSSSDRTNYTIVAGPANITIKYFHYWNAEPFGGKLAERQVWNTTGGMLESTTTSYQLENFVGNTFVQFGPHPQTIARPSRVYETAISRGTDWYKTRYGYNSNFASVNYSHGFPLVMHEWSNTAGSWTGRRTTDTDYDHLTSKWVLGLPTEVQRNGIIFDEHDYDSDGRRLWTDRFGSRWRTYTYHTTGIAAGLVKTVKDGIDRISSFNNYKRGHPQAVTRPDSEIIDSTVDDNGWITMEESGRGYDTFYQYNNMGWLTLIDPQTVAADTVFTYHDIGTATFRQNAVRDTEKTVTFYDGLFRPNKLRRQPVSGGGLTTTVATGYDIYGRTIFTSFPSLDTSPSDGTNTTYDALGRPTQIAENVAPYATTTLTYFAPSKTQTTDPEGHQTTVKTQGYGAPDDGGVIKIEQPTDVTTDIARDIYGNMTQVTQSGAHNGYSVSKVQRFYYDQRYRLCRHTVLETGDVLFQYDDANQMLRYATGQPTGSTCGSLPSADKVTLTYDDLGQVTFTNYPGNTFDITREYDLSQNLKKVIRGSTEWNYTYDNADRLYYEKLDIDGRTYRTWYTLNALGAVESVLTPGNRTVTYTPNGLGQATKATYGGVDYASSVDYHESGGLKDLTYGNGNILTHAYDARQLLTEIKVRDGGLKRVQQTYTHDDNGRILTIVDGVNAALNRTYTYDGLGRLATASGPWGAGTFKYDSLGNLREKTLGSRTVLMQYDGANRMARMRDSAAGNIWRDYVYDARGNVIDTDEFAAGSNRLTFTYDRAEQPTVIGGTASGNFTYDGNLKRAKQVIDGETIYSVYNLDGSLVYRDNITSGEVTEYIRVAGKTVARIKDDGTTESVAYLHQDHLGSAVAATNTSGTTDWTEDYTPFGETRPANDDPSPVDDDEAFTGHIKDDATGLTYMQARYYDPVIGRFLSGDPVGFSVDRPQMFNRYSYTLNDPVNAIDPDGGNPINNYYRGATDWARDTGYFIGGRMVVPVTQSLYSAESLQRFQLGLVLSDNIINFGVANAGDLGPRAVERMLKNPAYTAGRISAGAAVGRFALSKSGYGPIGGAALGVTMSTVGQVDRFAQSVVSGNADPNLELGSVAQGFIEGYFDEAGFDTQVTDNADGTSTFTASRSVTGSKIKQTISVEFRKEQADKD